MKLTWWLLGGRKHDARFSQLSNDICVMRKRQIALQSEILELQSRVFALEKHTPEESYRQTKDAVDKYLSAVKDFHAAVRNIPENAE